MNTDEPAAPLTEDCRVTSVLSAPGPTSSTEVPPVEALNIAYRLTHRALANEIFTCPHELRAQLQAALQQDHRYLGPFFVAYQHLMETGSREVWDALPRGLWADADDLVARLEAGEYDALLELVRDEHDPASYLVIQYEPAQLAFADYFTTAYSELGDVNRALPLGRITAPDLVLSTARVAAEFPAASKDLVMHLQKMVGKINRIYFIGPNVRIPISDYEFFGPTIDTLEFVLRIRDVLARLELEPNDRFLEVGVGSGTISQFAVLELMKRLGSAFSYYGTDIMDTALRHCRGLISQTSFTGPLTLFKDADSIEVVLREHGEGSFKFLFSNPPYITTEDISAVKGCSRLELSQASMGVELYRQVFDKGMRVLHPTQGLAMILTSSVSESAVRQSAEQHGVELVQLSERIVPLDLPEIAANPDLSLALERMNMLRGHGLIIVDDRASHAVWKHVIKVWVAAPRGRAVLGRFRG